MRKTRLMKSICVVIATMRDDAFFIIGVSLFDF